MKKNKLLNQIVVASVLSALGSFAAAQSTTSMFIPLNAKSFEKLVGNDLTRLNLLTEAKKLNPALNSIPNLEVQMIRLEAKSGIGGSQAFLRINNQMVDSQSIETDPDLLDSQDPLSFRRIELKNIDRALVSEASLVIQALSNTRIRSLELILGPVQEPVVFGRYAEDQIAQIGGGSVNAAGTEGDLTAVRPSADVVNAIYGRYYYQKPDVDAVTVVAPPAQPPIQPPVVVQPMPQVVTVDKPCARHRAGYLICVGDRVKNSWGFPGIVMAVDVRNQYVSAKFDFRDDIVTRGVDSFSK